MRSTTHCESRKPRGNRHKAVDCPVHRRRGDLPVHGRDDEEVETKVYDDGGEIRMVLHRGKTFQLLQCLVE